MLKNINSKLFTLQHDLGVGKFSSLLKKNKVYKDSFAGTKRCFILATGPSIKTQDLSMLEGELCISASNFFVHPLFNTVIKPAFHVFAGWHSPITEEQMTNWWRDAEKHLHANKDTTILIQAPDEKLIKKHSLFNNHKKLYYLPGGNYSVDFTKTIPPVQTVVHAAIYLAMYIGIKEIYLIGCDHSWILHYGQSQHFYQEQQHSFTRSNYNEWSEVKDIGQEFETYTSLWNIYRKLRTEAIKQNVAIYNATPGSLLDIFPRKELTAILNTI